MVRKGTAAVLLWLMTVTIVTSQPALRYCQCLDTIFLDGCPCPAEEKRPTTSSCGCDSCSPDCESPAFPCGECSIDLVYEMGDFVCTSAHDSDLVKTAMDSPVHFLPGEVIIPEFRFRASIHGIRGSPPPPSVLPAVSLRLRYSVFLV